MRYLLFVVWLLAAAACLDPRGAGSIATRTDAGTGAVTDSVFGGLVERLSEPGGYFDTDNLISNETSYLHVMGKLEELGVSGGAYIGVGPDQNFSYIAQVRPSIAFIIDIRRDNLLQQLMFKSVFELSGSRIGYLCMLFARPVPSNAAAWDGRTIQELVHYIDGTAVSPNALEVADRVARHAESFGVPLSEIDLETIRGFHLAFVRDGMGLRFRSHGRMPRPYYPTYRQLLLETDLDGNQVSYLASEERFQFVKSLQERNRLIPVVGDLGGGHALAAIGEVIEERGEYLSAFYTSNVEFYLMRGAAFDRYVANVQRLPIKPNSVIIRSYFGRNFGYAHPQAVPGYSSVQLLQTIDSFVTDVRAGGYRSYLDLVTRHAIDLH